MRTEKTATDTIREVSVDRLNWVRWISDSLLSPLTDAQVMHRAGGVGNHALWVMGHIASVDAYFCSSLGGQKPLFDEGFMSLFEGGSVVSDDARAYPSRQEVAGAMVSARENLIRWWSSLSDEEMGRELEGEVKRFAPDVRSLPVTIAAHEMFHTGQVATCRAALGLPRALR